MADYRIREQKAQRRAHARVDLLCKAGKLTSCIHSSEGFRGHSLYLSNMQFTAPESWEPTFQQDGVRTQLCSVCGVGPAEVGTRTRHLNLQGPACSGQTAGPEHHQGLAICCWRPCGRSRENTTWWHPSTKKKTSPSCSIPSPSTDVMLAAEVKCLESSSIITEQVMPDRFGDEKQQVD